MLEMMVVVAIVGILAALAVVNLTALNITAKINGEATVIAQMIRVTRMQAISTGCAHVFRYRGKGFIGTDPGTITVYRKALATCTVANPNDLLFAAGDLVVNTYQLSDNLLATAGTDLATRSIELGFNANGTTWQGENGAAWPLTPITVTGFRPSERNYSRTVVFLGGANVSVQ